MKTWKLVLALLGALAAGGLLMASQQSESESEAQEDVEDFVPTEKVPAGGAVSFPVDI